MSNFTQVEVLVNGTKDKKVCWVPEALGAKVGSTLTGGHVVQRVFTTLPSRAVPSVGLLLEDPDQDVFNPQSMDKVDVIVSKGSITVRNLETGDVLYEDHNVIVNGILPLFARLLTSNTEPLSSVYGIALGAGGTGSGGWSANTQPDPTPLQTAMVSEIKRKPFSTVRYLDSNGNPTAAITNVVQFNTIFNATTDDITVPIREMGLIGGGTTSTAAGGPTNMLTAPYWDPAVANPNSVSLLTYKTTPPFTLPTETSVGISWVLTL